MLDGDSLVKVLFINEQAIGILTHRGIFKTIETSPITSIGRIAQGVIGIKLDTNDYVVDSQIINPEDIEVISISDEGLCARTSLQEFLPMGRAAKGKQLQKGNLISFIPIAATDQNIIISSSQNLIKFLISSINLTNKGAIGTKAINLKSDKIIGVIKDT